MSRCGLIAPDADEVVLDCALARASVSVNQIAIVALKVQQNAVPTCLVASILVSIEIVAKVAGTLCIIHCKMSGLIAHETGLLVVDHSHRYAAVKNTALIVQYKSDPAITNKGGCVELKDTLITLCAI